MLKINCDMGESFGAWTMGDDSHVMPHIDMANIACGFHASDPLTMAKTVELALASGVAIGAHPSYPDLLGFGRREMSIAPAELKQLVIYQIGALNGICQALGAEISYVKPHGALYNKMVVDEATLRAVLEAVSQYNAGLSLVVMAVPESENLTRLAREYGVNLLFEVFTDRAYDENGRLASRSIPGAVFHTDIEIERQARAIIERSAVITLEGAEIPVSADTICIHGDGPRAVQTAQLLRSLIG